MMNEMQYKLGLITIKEWQRGFKTWSEMDARLTRLGVRGKDRTLLLQKADEWATEAKGREFGRWVRKAAAERRQARQDAAIYHAVYHAPSSVAEAERIMNRVRQAAAKRRQAQVEAREKGLQCQMQEDLD